MAQVITLEDCIVSVDLTGKWDSVLFIKSDNTTIACSPGSPVQLVGVQIKATQVLEGHQIGPMFPVTANHTYLKGARVVCSGPSLSALTCSRWTRAHAYAELGTLAGPEYGTMTWALEE